MWVKHPDCGFCDDAGHYMGTDHLCPCGRQVAVTAAQRDILRHALGHGRGPELGWRNHYAIDPDSDTWADVQALVASGLMRAGRLVNPPPDQMQYFHATAAGKRAAR